VSREPGGERREERWEGFGGGPGRGGNIDGRPLSGKGKLGWRFPETGGAEVDTDLVIAAPPACLNGALYVPVGGARAGLLCLREEKNRPVDKWFAAASNGVALSPAATSNRVFFADGRKGDGRRSLRCVDAAGGDEKWRVPVDAEASGEFVLTDEGLLVADVPDGLTAFTRGGATAWRTRCGEVLGMPCAAGPLAVAAVGGPAGVLVLDGATGRQLWRAPLESAAAAGPVVRKNVICVGTPAGVAALSLADGRRLWETAGGAPGAPLALLKSGLAYTTADGRLVVVDTEKGAVAWEAGDAVPGLSPLATGGFVVFVNKSGLAARPAAGGDEEPWKTIESWLGLPVCSPVMADSRVYVATDRKGLLCLKSK
jgi:outer membrane protein assembly factor BamB